MLITEAILMKGPSGASARLLGPRIRDGNAKHERGMKLSDHGNTKQGAKRVRGKGGN